MVFGFVEQSGGHIEVDSAVGHGTTITIRLPMIAVLDQRPNPTRSPAERRRRKKVLLVEDDPDVRIVMAAQLKQLGYTVHAVANGMEAIHLIELPAKIDIILTDIVLPGGIDGVHLAKEAMRARPPWACCACRAMTRPTSTASGSKFKISNFWKSRFPRPSGASTRSDTPSIMPMYRCRTRTLAPAHPQS